MLHVAVLEEHKSVAEAEEEIKTFLVDTGGIRWVGTHVVSAVKRLATSLQQYIQSDEFKQNHPLADEQAAFRIAAERANNVRWDTMVYFEPTPFLSTTADE